MRTKSTATTLYTMWECGQVKTTYISPQQLMNDSIGGMAMNAAATLFQNLPANLAA